MRDEIFTLQGNVGGRTNWYVLLLQSSKITIARRMHSPVNEAALDRSHALGFAEGMQECMKISSTVIEEVLFAHLDVRDALRDWLRNRTGIETSYDPIPKHNVIPKFSELGVA